MRPALAALLLLCAGCSPGRPPAERELERDRAAISDTRAAYVSAWKAADPDALAALYAEDALLLFPNQAAVAGKSAIHAYFDAYFVEMTQQEFERNSEELQISGSWAFDRGTYRWKGVPQTGGAPLEDHGKYLTILLRGTDGSWKLFRDMGNSDRSAG